MQAPANTYENNVLKKLENSPSSVSHHRQHHITFANKSEKKVIDSNNYSYKDVSVDEALCRDKSQSSGSADVNQPKLNQIQLAVYKKACQENCNLLVCAPTGSGKTTIAMMTIARLMKENKTGLEKTKAIYIAPIKALASEMLDLFSKELKHLGIEMR
jgi:replicative superfamily II helicase